MVQRCSVCPHPSRPEIDRGLLHGVPYRSLGGQFGLSPNDPVPQRGRPDNEIC